MRRDLKWHACTSAPYVKSIEDFVALADEDTDACFFG
jgi:hypothetical protein